MFLHVGNRISELSEEKKIIPAELARLTGRAKQLVSADLRKNSLNSDVLYKYCEALNVSFAEFFKEDVERLKDDDKAPCKSSKELHDELENCRKEFEELKEKYIKALEQIAELKIRQKT